jgi:uncharacterized protein YndB with AHSA1/START domain
MTRQRSFKRLVRIRMEKTGESYAAARAMLLSANGKSDGAVTLTMSDEAIRTRTGRGWEEWFDLLDDWGASERSHTEIARWITKEQGLDGWSSQSVTVSYERARAGRALGEHADGFSVTASKTVAVPVDRLYQAFHSASRRKRWLPDGTLRVRTSIEPRSIRFDWGDGSTRVNVGFTDKGAGKSQVALEHSRLPDAAEADRMKAYWRERVGTLKEQLEA